jgi:hypothetical protein
MGGKGEEYEVHKLRNLSTQRKNSKLNEKSNAF